MTGGEVDDGDTAFAAVRDIQHLGVAADVQAMRALASREEVQDAETLAIDQVHAMGPHVSDVKHFAIR